MNCNVANKLLQSDDFVWANRLVSELLDGGAWYFKERRFLDKVLIIKTMLLDRLNSECNGQRGHHPPGLYCPLYSENSLSYDFWSFTYMEPPGTS